MDGCSGEYWSIIMNDGKNEGEDENLCKVETWVCMCAHGGWVEKQDGGEWKKASSLCNIKCDLLSKVHTSITNYMISPAACLSLSPFYSSHPECVQGGGPEQEDDSDPGGGAGLRQLHEQGPERQRLRLQGLQSQQDRWHQVQHRQVGQGVGNVRLTCSALDSRRYTALCPSPVQ